MQEEKMYKYKLQIELELEDKPEWIYKSIQELLQNKESITLFRYQQEELNESIN
jgi:hypothetical protein